MLAEGGTWVDTFTLPSLASPALSRSHSGHHPPFYFSNMTLLRSYLPSPAQDWMQKFDLLVQHRAFGDDFERTEFSFLHLILLHDGTLSMDVLNSCRFEFPTLSSSWNFSQCHGVARAISALQYGLGPSTVYGYNVTEDPDQRGSITYSQLPGLMDMTSLAFDGFRGRLCFCRDTRLLTSIEIHDYV